MLLRVKVYPYHCKKFLFRDKSKEKAHHPQLTVQDKLNYWILWVKGREIGGFPFAHRRGSRTFILKLKYHCRCYPYMNIENGFSVKILLLCEYYKSKKQYCHHGTLFITLCKASSKQEKKTHKGCIKSIHDVMVQKVAFKDFVSRCWNLIRQCVYYHYELQLYRSDYFVVYKYVWYVLILICKGEYYLQWVETIRVRWPLCPDSILL